MCTLKRSIGCLENEKKNYANFGIFIMPRKLCDDYPWFKESLLFKGLKTTSFATSRLLLFWEALIRQQTGYELSELSWTTRTTELGCWTCAKMCEINLSVFCLHFDISFFWCLLLFLNSWSTKEIKTGLGVQKVGRRQRWWIIRVFCKCTQVLSKIAVQSEICQNVYSAAVLAGSQTLALTQCSTTLSKINSLGRFALSVGFINSCPQRAESIGVAQKGPCWSQIRVGQKLGFSLVLKLSIQNSYICAANCIVSVHFTKKLFWKLA